MNYNTAVVPAGVQDVVRVLFKTKQPRFKLITNDKKSLGRCYVCGKNDGFNIVNVINDDLSSTWNLSRKLRKNFDFRESSNCNNCKASLRSNLHARTICLLLAPNTTYLQAAVQSRDMRQLKIAEINMCGALHRTLKELPKLAYSEFVPHDTSIRHEDLTKLTYKNGQFDAVLTSETLEHIPDWQKAFAEIHRVLKPGGVHIFTVPAILTRKTRSRVAVENDKVKHLLPKSFHGCTSAKNSDDYVVCSEFGADILHDVDELGFDTKLYFRNALHLSDPNFVFVSTKL